tara:strand:+ start:220 stop:1665 length:1446 start_codon:yes stop_codon:yes gene_type:complete
MSTTKVLLRKEIDSQINTLLSEASEKVDDLLNCQLSFLYGKSPLQAQIIDTLRIVSEMSTDDSSGHALRNLLVNTVLTSEGLWAGSGFISLVVLLEANKSLQKIRHMGGSYDIDQAALSREITRSSRRSSSKEIFESLNCLTRSSYELDLTRQILEMCGSSSSANISDTVGMHTFIERHSGYNISVDPSDLFWTASQASIISLYSPKIVCIDGICESMSELHNIIDTSFQTGQSVVIFARGFHDDVTNTLAVNHAKGMLNVIPITVPYDLMGVNQLVDIAVCCKTDVVSSLKGELISTIEWENLKEIDQIKIVPGNTVIRNPSSKKRADRHRASIQKKYINLLNKDLLQKEGEADLTGEQINSIRDSNREQGKIMQKRMLSLMSSGVKVVLGKEHGSTHGLRKDRVQTLLRVYGQGSKHGLVNLYNINTENLDYISSNVISRLKAAGLSSMSPPSLACGFRVGLANAKLMQKIGAWLAIDE